LEGHAIDNTKPEIPLDYNDPGKGEDSNYCGVVIHAPASQVHVSSPTIEFASSYKIVFRAVKDRVVDIFFRCRNLMTWCLDSFSATCSKDQAAFGSENEGSGLFMDLKNLDIVGQQTIISSNKNTTVLSQAGAQYVAFNPARGTTQSGSLRKVHDGVLLQTSLPADEIAAKAIEKEDKIRFTFRTSAQYGTDEANEIKNIGEYDGRMTDTKKDGIFKVYQSPWQFIYANAKSMVPWYEYWIDETAPWPGYRYYDSDKCYYYLPKEVNVDIKTGSRSVKRSEATNEPAQLKYADMNSYQAIVKSESNDLTS
jgi:hypothetical protein